MFARTLSQSPAAALNQSSPKAYYNYSLGVECSTRLGGGRDGRGADSSRVDEVEEVIAESFFCNEPGCNYAGAKAVNLRKHQASLHSGAKQFKCIEPGCEYVGAKAGNLNRHVRKHGANKQYAFKAGASKSK